jgi:uncharacterized protein (TIGR04255 family)
VDRDYRAGRLTAGWPGGIRMPSPEVQLPLYKNGPLVEVVCQLHYAAPIPSLDKDIQNGLKDKLKKDYFYDKKAPDEQGKPNNLAFGQDVPMNTSYHFFQSKDKRWRLRISRRMLSLSTTSYDGWDKFSEKILELAGMFSVAYVPDRYRHVCVRYRNAIRREVLNLAGVPWSRLIQPWACGPLADAEMAESVSGGVGKWLLKPSSDEYFIDATCALADEQPSKTKAFIIETHTYSNTPTRPSDVGSHLSRIHLHASRFFHSAITRELHAAFGPEDGT